MGIKLDFYDQQDVRFKLYRLMEVALRATRDLSYQSDVLEPYAFKRMEEVLEEMEEVKQFWLAKKREHAVKDMVTAMDEAGV